MAWLNGVVSTNAGLLARDARVDGPKGVEAQDAASSRRSCFPLPQRPGPGGVADAEAGVSSRVDAASGSVQSRVAPAPPPDSQLRPELASDSARSRGSVHTHMSRRLFTPPVRHAVSVSDACARREYVGCVVRLVSTNRNARRALRSCSAHRDAPGAAPCSPSRRRSAASLIMSIVRKSGRRPQLKFGGRNRFRYTNSMEYKLVRNAAFLKGR